MQPNYCNAALSTFWKLLSLVELRQYPLHKTFSRLVSVENWDLQLTYH